MQPREAWSGVQQDPHAGAAALRRSAANMPTGAGAAMMAPAQAQMMQQGRAQSANAGPGAREAAERALAARVASMVTERQQLGRPANMGGGAPGMAAGQGRPPPMQGSSGIAAGSGIAALRASCSRPGSSGGSSGGYLFYWVVIG